MKELTESEALNKAAAYCSLAERCPAEVEAKLLAWGIASEAATRRILDFLKRENFLNEERYCRAFIRDKYRFSQWGRQKIAMALRQKQISATLYASCFAEEIDEEEYRSILKKLLAAKQRATRARNRYELEGKLIRFALSRGFEMEDIRACMDIECF